MRLPVVPQISTKDGVSNKNARLTNCLKESKKGGDKAVVRPGLVFDAQASGIGNGLVVFNNELVSVYGATLGLNTAAGVAEWTASATNQQVFSAVYGNGVFVGYNSLSRLTYSTDGITWTQVDGFALPSILIAYGANGFICGGFGTYRLSTDGVTWSSNVSPLNADTPAYGSGRYVMVDYAETEDDLPWTSSYAYSTNGTSWTSGSTSINDELGISVAFVGSYFFALCQSGAIHRSSDGVTWTAGSVLPSWVEQKYKGGITYAFGNYYIQTRTGLIYSSADGLTFSATTFQFAAAINYGDGIFFDGSFLWASILTTTVGRNDHAYTRDGITWAEVTNGAKIRQLTSDGISLLSCYGFDTISVSYLIGAGNDTIPALTTITGDYYDFAQSPI